MNFDEYKEDIRAAVEVMNRGGVILYPTDTIWGIGCDATNAEAVKRVYEIKKRDDSKAYNTCRLRSKDRVLRAGSARRSVGHDRNSR